MLPARPWLGLFARPSLRAREEALTRLRGLPRLFVLPRSSFSACKPRAIDGTPRPRASGQGIPLGGGVSPAVGGAFAVDADLLKGRPFPAFFHNESFM